MNLLMELFRMSYVATFGTTNYDTIEFSEGQEMLFKWHDRNVVQKKYFDNNRVISCEIKDNFMVPTSIGDLPFNYIWDRFDQIGEKTFKVVDYKTNRWGLQPSDLRKKIQARAYGLAAAIQLKAQNIEYDKIWVEFDLLRHTPVGTVFTYQDNVSFWSYLKESVEEIIATKDDEVQEKLNPECLFCVRKAQCTALQKNVLVGGLHSVGTIEDAIDLRSELEWQKKGLESLISDLDKKILTEAKTRDMQEFESDQNRLKITVGYQRRVDAEMVETAIGAHLFAKYGGKSFTMASVDKLLKGKELTDEQKAALRSLIYQQAGEPRVKIEPKNPIDED
jgi:hypothetical protein